MDAASVPAAGGRHLGYASAYDRRMTNAQTSTVIVNELQPPTLLELTGWHLEDRGACRDDVCVPLPEASRSNTELLAAALNVALVHDEQHGVWAVGPEARAHALASATLPDLTLRRADNGAPFALASLIGRRGVLMAWASW